MRILFTFAGAWGHLDPLVPVARAATAAGHPVAFAGRPWMVPKVRGIGFESFPSGTDAGLTPKRIPLETSIANERRGPVSGFGLRLPRERSPDLLRICETWRPDAIVWEETDLAGGLVAERLGILHARLLVLAEGSFLGPEVLAEPIRVLRMEQGLPADPDLEMLGRHLVLSPIPPSFRNPAVRLPATAHDLRPGALGDGMESSPRPSPPRVPARPTVYLTLGTVFPLESGDLFARVVSALRNLPVDLIVTVGPDFDPTELGPQPANVRVECWIPQQELLPRCDVVVSHGGSGSVIGALAHGVPLVLIPIGADQLLNAARCATLGVGRVLDPLMATRREIREAVSAVLSEPSYRHAAREIAEESAALPDASHAVDLLEQLGSDTIPGPALSDRARSRSPAWRAEKR